jgi:hypothetical protein
LFVLGITASPKTQVDLARGLRVRARLSSSSVDSAHLLVVQPELQLFLSPDKGVIVKLSNGVLQSGIEAVALVAVTLSVPVRRSSGFLDGVSAPPSFEVPTTNDVSFL